MSPFRPQAGEVIAGRYRVVRALGAGGAGQVFEVTDEELRGTTVALKVLHASVTENPELFERFRAEVLIARNLVHPSIVRVFDLGRTEDGLPFLTMEFVSGETLKDRIQRTFTDLGGAAPGSMPVRPTVLPFDDLISFLRQLLDAVGYAHERGVVHRDLKPGNILVQPDNTLKLLDFGTARILESDANLTKTGEVIGTPLYMAPEVIRSEQIDGRCDLYAIGLIAAEMVLGVHPLKSAGALEALVRHLHEPLPPLENGPFKAPKWLDAVIRRAAEKDREARFRTAAEFRAALEEGPAAPAVPRKPRVGWPLRVLLIAAVGTVWYTGLARREPIYIVPGKQPEPSVVPQPSVSPQPSASALRQPSPIAAPSPLAVLPTAAPASAAPATAATVEVASPPLPPSVPRLVAATAPATLPPAVTPSAAEPTAAPTPHPTAQPTPLPTAEPTAPPTAVPTEEAVEPVVTTFSTPSQPEEIFFRLSSESGPRREFDSAELGDVRWVATIPKPASMTDGASGILPGVELEVRPFTGGPVQVTSHARLLAVEAASEGESGTSTQMIRVGGMFGSAGALKSGKYEVSLRSGGYIEVRATLVIR